MCPGCGGDVEPDFIACPLCARRLKLTCSRCRSALKPEWRLCPYCEAPAPTQQQRTMTLYETST